MEILIFRKTNEEINNKLDFLEGIKDIKIKLETENSNDFNIKEIWASKNEKLFVVKIFY